MTTKTPAWKLEWKSENAIKTEDPRKKARIEQGITEAIQNGVFISNPLPVAITTPANTMLRTLENGQLPYFTPSSILPQHESLINYIRQLIQAYMGPAINLNQCPFLHQWIHDIVLNHNNFSEHTRLAMDDWKEQYMRGDSAQQIAARIDYGINGPYPANLDQIRNWIQRRDIMISDCASQGITAEESARYHYFGIARGGTIEEQRSVYEHIEYLTMHADARIQTLLLPADPMDPDNMLTWNEQSHLLTHNHTFRRYFHRLIRKFRALGYPYRLINRYVLVITVHGIDVTVRPYLTREDLYFLDLQDSTGIDLSNLPTSADLKDIDHYLKCFLMILHPRANIPLKDSPYEVFL